MPIRITCPGCQTVLTLADTMRGKKVRCKSCDKVIGIPAASKKKVLADGADVDEEEAVQEEPKLQVKAKAKPEPEEETEADEDRPKKKKKKKKKDKGSMGLAIGIVAVVAVLLLVGGGIGLFVILKPPDNQKKNQVAQVDGKKDGAIANPNPNVNGNAKDKVVVPPVPQPQPQGNKGVNIIPKIQDGNPAKKGGDGIINNVRGAGYRTERRSELKQIGTAFIQYSDDFKGNNRNDNTWLDYIKTFGPIRDAVKDGYYKMNYSARLDSASVIAYERDIDQGRHLCVRGDGSVDYVPLAELKTILGRDP
ncbi:MAG TPA: hypothetical protein VFE62_11750 [Gemmataceae bacterium]|nr:hypothetical protein [Gemmataceae bacterium]